MFDTFRTTVGVIAVVVLILSALAGLLVLIERRFGSQGSAMLLLGLIAGGLVALAAWGLA